MADFSTPFGLTAGRRLPTADEKVNGFPCGPADQTLFNGLFHRIEAELAAVIAGAGLVPSNSDNTQLKQAIQGLIDASTGGGEETSTYLLLSQAASRLPIYPEILTSDNKIVVTSPSTGTVRVPGGSTFLHRGISSIDTVETDLGTSSSKTYHLRWNPDDGYQLKDLSDTGGYNPGSLNETDPSFDSSYDSMLIARVVTNSSNVATITNLANVSRFLYDEIKSAVATKFNAGTTNDAVRYEDTFTLNQARTPKVMIEGSITASTAGTPESYMNYMQTRTVTRYSVTAKVVSDWASTVSGAVTGYLRLLAVS